jgi:hypothetical protein
MDPLFTIIVLLTLGQIARATAAAHQELRTLRQRQDPPPPVSRAEHFARAKAALARLDAEGKTQDAAWLRAEWGTALLADARAQGRFPLSPEAIARQPRPSPKVD